MDKKQLVVRYGTPLSLAYRLFGGNKIKAAKGNTVRVKGAFLRHCSISVSGTGNTIEIAPGITRLKNCTLSISGSGCTIMIGPDCNLVGSHFFIEDDNGRIELKRHVTVSGDTEFAALEGTGITVGEDCLFSSAIRIRTGDSHSILDAVTGERLNPSRDIEISEHVWIGSGVRILKGVKIGHDSVIAAGALITSGDYPPNTVIGGTGHAKVLKTNIVWTPQRIPPQASKK